MNLWIRATCPKTLLAGIVPVLFFCTQVMAQEAPCKTVQECVERSGGVYAVVDQVEAKGLTNSDQPNSNLSLIPNITLHKKLIMHQISSMIYHGQKGEEIDIKVSSKYFIPRLFLLDANGRIIGSNTNDQKKGSIELKQRLSYKGEYEIQVMELDLPQEGEFDITLYSQKPDVELPEAINPLKSDEFYPIHELHRNLALSATYKTQGTIIYKYKPSPCPQGAACKVAPPHIVISEEAQVIDDYNYSHNPIRLIAYYNYNLESMLFVGEKYQWTLKAENLSKTDKPENRFSVIALGDN